MTGKNIMTLLEFDWLEHDDKREFTDTAKNIQLILEF